jgi:hypothetical protein
MMDCALREHPYREERICGCIRIQRVLPVAMPFFFYACRHSGNEKYFEVITPIYWLQQVGNGINSRGLGIMAGFWPKEMTHFG